MNDVYANHIKKLKDFYADMPIYLIFDETIDASGRYILNILIGECSKESRKKPILLKVIKLNRTNSENINTEVLQTLNMLYDGEINKYKNLKLLITDIARYAIKTVNMLKTVICDIKHVTCLCHGIHNLCESIRNDYTNDNSLISF